jgi:nucleoside-diphosphate-sugar epimerase
LNILVTGACGYKGSVLIPKLLKQGHYVDALDIQWFGNELPIHKNLRILKQDVRNVSGIDLESIDAIIHLASVANDPCGDLDPKLTWEISALATMQLADHAARNGIKHFIYASSGSVYGVKDEEQVTEDLSLEPISEYNKTKMVSERVLLSYADRMTVQIIRPATVCGISPRMRLDVAVNMLTMQALKNGVITVFGGPDVKGVFNAGFENITILDIAKRINEKLGSEIVVTPSNDPRSYRINSDKLLATGFKPKYSVEHAINEIIDAFNAGKLVDQDRWYNLKWMQQTLFNAS